MRDHAKFSLLSLAVRAILNSSTSSSVSAERPDASSFNPRSPIQLAAFHRDEEILEVLLPEQFKKLLNLSTDKKSQSALETALTVRYKYVVSQLLGHGADVNFLFLGPDSVACLQTSLGWIASHADHARLLLGRGARYGFHRLAKSVGIA